LVQKGFAGATLTEAQPQQEPPLAELGDVLRIVQSSNRFAMRLYSQMVGHSPGNLFFSPSSVVRALAMTYSGAGGETAREIADSIGFDLPSDRLHKAFKSLQEQTRTGGIELRVANRLWGQSSYHFLPEFLQTTERCYRASMATVDFKTDAEEARHQINLWAEEHTSGRIKHLVSPGMLTPMTRLVLASAIYFLGCWEDEFDEEQTVDDVFSTGINAERPIRMMCQSGRFGYADLDDCQVLALPYRSKTYEVRPTLVNGISIDEYAEVESGGSDFVMNIFLPRKVDGLSSLESRLASESLPRYLRLRSCEVDVQVPRFRIESTHAIGHALEELGIRMAFVQGEADFSQMSDDPEGLFLGPVLQNAFVEVNEKGTEAAAVTIAVAIGGCAAVREPPKVFRADRPFLFLIRDRTSGLIHFIGRVISPEYSE
jgi:serpin B